MLPEVISISKSMSFRLEEYQNLLDEVDTPCSEINEVWARIFEGVAIVNTGWQGLWMPSPKNCEKYNFLYPTVIIVSVDAFNWKELTATVSVIAVQEDILLPSVLDIPILELYPIKEQDYDKLNLMSIADWLDKYRYFFKYLWYPWDAKDKVTMSDWCENHLKNRLQIQYDAKNGAFDPFTVNYLKSLIAEARDIGDSLLNMPDNVTSAEEKLNVVNYYIRRKITKVQLDLFEEPEFRDGLLLKKKHESNLLDPPRRNDKGEVRFVWSGGPVTDFENCFGVAKKLMDEDVTIKVSDSLQGTLDKSRQDDMVLIGPGEHFMKSLGNIKHGGSVKGLCQSASDVIIKPDQLKLKRAILFECLGFINLENLNIIHDVGFAVQVCQKLLRIHNCVIKSGGLATTKGIVVLSGCSCEIENSELEGLGTGIMVQKNAVVKITNTRIHNCYEGIKVVHESKLFLDKVNISSCSSYGMRIESSKIENQAPVIGDANIIKGFENLKNDIECNSVILNDNRKGNVIVKKIRNDSVIQPANDADQSNETIYLSDEEEEEEENDEDYEDSVETGPSETNLDEKIMDEAGDY